MVPTFSHAVHQHLKATVQEPLNVGGSVMEAKRPEKLVYTFTIEPFSGAMTTVTWLLQEVHGGTRLVLEHEGIGAAAGNMALPLLMALDAGWDAHLGQLRDLVK